MLSCPVSLSCATAQLSSAAPGPCKEQLQRSLWTLAFPPLGGTVLSFCQSFAGAAAAGWQKRGSNEQMVGDLGQYFPLMAVLVSGVMSVVVSRLVRAHRQQDLGSVSLAQCLSSQRLSRTTLALTRLAIGVLELGAILRRIPQGTLFTYCYGVGERRSCVPYGGVWLFSTFTVWCWTGQALYFIAAGIAGLCVSERAAKSARARPSAFALWVWYELMFTVALVVTTLVWVVLVPYIEFTLLKCEAKTEVDLCESVQQGRRIMWSATGLALHNVNTAAMALEMWLNSLSFHPQHRYSSTRKRERSFFAQTYRTCPCSLMCTLVCMRICAFA